MQDKPTDEELVKRTLDGDPYAFRLLVSRYQDLVFTVILRVVSHREEAEEAAQDVFMKVYAHLHSWEGSARFSTWLYRIAYNTALTRLRNRKPQTVLLDDKSEAALGHQAGNAYNEAERTFRSQDVSGAIKMLSPDDAAVITLFYLAEQSIEEVAVALNIEPNAAKVRLHRARKKLKEKMGKAKLA